MPLQSYEMKDSGVEWIGEIPKHWKCLSFKKIIKQNDGGVWGEDPIGEGGITVLRSTEQTVDGKWCIEQPAKRDLSKISNVNYYRLQNGDLLLTKSSGSLLHIGKTTIVDADIAKLNCCYSNFMQRIRLIENSYSRFYWYILNSSISREQFAFLQNSTSGIGNINSSHINNIIIPVPPLSEQQSIAAYLDEKCAAIDEIIAEAKATIDEYKSWKASVIFEAVTKGLNPNAEMKDSGVEWIGRIPSHYSMIKLRKLIKKIESGVSVNAGQEPAISPEFGVLKTSSVSQYRFKPTENKNVNRDEYSRVSCPVKHNTIIVSRMNTPELVGACGYVDCDYDNLFLPDRLWQVHFLVNVCVKYIYYFLCSNFVKNYYASLSTGTSSSMQNISQSQFANVVFPMPSLTEQQSIVAYLDEKCAAIDGVIAEKEALIGELESYKKSLIFETVTGKRRVC